MIFRKRADLLTPPHNYAVVQLPGRNYPGVVFQGDSLNGLCTSLDGIVEGLSQEGTKADALENLKEVHKDLVEIKDGYERFLEGRKYSFYKKVVQYERLLQMFARGVIALAVVIFIGGIGVLNYPKTDEKYYSPRTIYILSADVEQTRRKAELGDAKAALDLAGYYSLGDGANEEYADKKFGHWQMVAAENGDIETQKYLVHEYAQKALVNVSEAKVLLQYAASKNWQGAQAELDKIIKDEAAKAQRALKK